jgi:hypothetical protein
MRKIPAALAVLLFSLAAAAETLPTAVDRSIKPFALTGAGLAGGILTATFNREVVTFSVFESFVTNGVCMPLIVDPKAGWGKSNIERVEVRNSAGAQGFALGDLRKACGDIGDIAGGAVNVKKYLAPIALVCVSGQACRVRRAGEKTSGDEG